MFNRMTIFKLGCGMALPPLLIACMAQAFAAQRSDGFVTRINIQTSCALTANPMNFGNVGIINGGEQATATVNVNCSSSTPYALSFSSSAVTTSFAGQMVNGPAHVNYSAFLLGPNTGTGSNVHTIVGTLPAQPTPASATYIDTRTIYVNY